MQKKCLLLFLILISLTFLVSCAPADPLTSSTIYGFWGGLWHGYIAFFAFVGKMIGYMLYFFNKSWGDWNIGLWADHNTGLTYWIGYAIGFFCISGSQFLGLLKEIF